MTSTPASPFDQSNAPGGQECLPEPLPSDPFPLFRMWWNEAHLKKVQPNPNAMTVATLDADGRIGARILLCKEVNDAAGYLVFYTNYTSRKGLALGANARAALVFHWDTLDRQVRVEGSITRSPAEESDAYFATRPWQSRIGAWASDQSKPIGSRAAMQDKIAQTMRRFGIDPANPQGEGVLIPRPPHWGGFRVWAQSIELWAAATGRLHERAAWTRTLSPGPQGFEGGPWRATRLQP